MHMCICAYVHMCVVNVVVLPEACQVDPVEELADVQAEAGLPGHVPVHVCSNQYIMYVCVKRF